jgi:sulfonate transport system substrate-binding protein
LAVIVIVVAAVAVLWPRHREAVVLHVGDQRGAIRALMQGAGELDHTPYKIEWDIFPVGAPLIEAMKAGAVDFGYVGSSTMTFGLAAGAPIKAINVWRFDGPGSGVLVAGNSPIKTVADLRGKRIAVVRGSPGHLLVIEALEQAGVPLKDVTIINLSAGDAKAALTSGSIDAWAIWDPFLAIGEQQDHDRVIITSAQVAREVECGVASDRAIATKRAQLLDFIGRVQRAYAWSEAHPEAAAQSYAKETGVPLDIARIVRGRQRVAVLTSVTDEAIAAHQHAADVYARVGLIPKPIDIAQVYDRSFVIGGR